ncbi:Protein phosphatase 1 regulatory subunit 14B [Sciurus carolinensis]|uniref:Protein phosphatase 1 regulatory subunit 14 n=1 Tax=Sciurus carolinensis TaxID=30640 RepID=A0AA41MJX7_SCICA|nr:Protein phosphatase 1 regulatory subunit 14B [Sciurus carolinensis]
MVLLESEQILTELTRLFQKSRWSGSVYVTLKKYDGELRKRLNQEEWILEQLTHLYNCQEEEIPELEIDVDELLDMESDDTRAARVKELLVDCYKPTEAFISGLLDKIGACRS